MSLPLQWRRADDGTLVVEGELTEKSDLAGLLAALGSDEVMELSGITHINSTGVRVWLQMMKEIRASARSVVFARCSVPFVNQLNMISTFGQGARIQSAMAPYLCLECDTILSHCIDLAHQLDEALAKPVPCPSCGQQMTFDDVQSLYFGFLGRT